MKLVYRFLLGFLIFITATTALSAQTNDISFENQYISNDSMLLAMRIEKTGKAISENIKITNSNAIPAYSLYGGKWYNTDVKISSDRLFDKNETYVLPLMNENENNFVFPYQGKVISPFGYRGGRVHTGTDIKLNLNDEVYAAFDGVVRMAKRYSGYGNIVVIRHYNGLESVYSHLNKIKVNVNQRVSAGDVVGLGGRTGRATTCHLHFELRFLGNPFNAEKLLDFENFKLKSDTLIIDKNTFLKSKKFIYKKNKKGKRVKVYINDDSENEFKSNLNSEENKNVFTYSDFKSDTSSFKVEEVETKSVENTKITNTEKNTKVTNNSKYHKVKKGDTLSKISRKYGIRVAELCKLNNIKENDILNLGQNIRLR
jgi:murein DD-endopeptidase MepM/ murein hydrolase activator NlpD